jgi:hypothetical protein
MGTFKSIRNRLHSWRFLSKSLISYIWIGLDANARNSQAPLSRYVRHTLSASESMPDFGKTVPSFHRMGSGTVSSGRSPGPFPACGEKHPAREGLT